jgi:hypothetical protein
MRRILPVLIVSFVTAIPVFAQRGGGHGGGGGGMHGGGMRGGSSGMRGGGGGGVGFHGGSGFRGIGFRGGFNRGFRFRGRFGIVPFYGYYGGYGFYDPFFYDSYPSSPYDGGYPYAGAYSNPGYGSNAPSVTIISNSPWYPAAPAPEIVAPMGPPPAPAVREYPPAAQEQKYETPLFLLAFKDGSIRAVLAYWVDGMTLHYVSMDHEQKQTPLSSIDRDLSERFNHERNVTFRLPR